MIGVKKSIGKGIATLAFSMVLAVGITPVSEGLYHMIGETWIAKAQIATKEQPRAKTAFFDPGTGILTLRGNVVKEDVQEYAYSYNVEKVVATSGTVLPENCSGLFAGLMAKEIDLTEANTENVRNVSSMFSSCWRLKSMDLDALNLTDLEDVSCLFADCQQLAEVGISELDTSKVTNMYSLFMNCSSLGSIDVSNFDTSKVTKVSDMFNGCSSLTAVDISTFDLSNATDFINMFYQCTNLRTLDLSQVKFGKEKRLDCMFRNCESLAELNLGQLGASGTATNMTCMFENCAELSELDLSKMNTSHVTDMSCLFMDCCKLGVLDLRSFNTSAVQDMKNMFRDCSSLKKIAVSEQWSTQNVASDRGRDMFLGCLELVGENGTTYTYANRDLAYAHVDEEGNPGYLSWSTALTKVVITRQPINWYGTIGKKASFSVEAEGEAGTILSYDWQFCKKGVWCSYGLTTADTPNFKVSMNSTNIKYPIRCVITDPYGATAITREVWMKDASVSAPITITKQPKDWTGVIGKKATFAVTAVGETENTVLTYQWQYKKGTKWKPYTVATATTATLKVTMNETTIQYPVRCVITDEDGRKAYSNEVWMHLKEDPVLDPIVITKQPVDWTGIMGKKACFDVEATGEGLTYQWQYLKGRVWTDYAITTADTPNFRITMNEKTVNWIFHCVIVDAKGNTITTNEVRMILKEEAPDPITIITQPCDWYGKYGQKASFNVEAVSADPTAGLTYQWQYLKGNTWYPYEIATADTPNFKVTMNEKNVKWAFRCVITDVSGYSVTTQEVCMHLENGTN